MKTWKDIERARERRLWIKEIFFPGAIATITVLKLFPEVGETIKRKYADGKNFIVSRFKKEK